MQTLIWQPNIDRNIIGYTQIKIRIAFDTRAFRT